MKEVLSRTEGAPRDASGHCSQVSDKQIQFALCHLDEEKLNQ